MKQSLHSILSTKCCFDFSSGQLINKHEDIGYLTNYHPKVTIKVSPCNSTPKTLSKKSSITNWNSIYPSNRPTILLNTLLQDMNGNDFSPHNSGCNWTTSSNKRIRANYTPPIKKSVLLIKHQSNDQPAIGHYNPAMMPKKVRGSVQLHKNSRSQQSISLSQLFKSIVLPEPIPEKEEQPFKVQEARMSYFIQSEQHKLNKKLSFQPKVLNLDNDPFKQQMKTFQTYKNKWKVLKDQRV